VPPQPRSRERSTRWTARNSLPRRSPSLLLSVKSPAHSQEPSIRARALFLEYFADWAHTARNGVAARICEEIPFNPDAFPVASILSQEAARELKRNRLRRIPSSTFSVFVYPTKCLVHWIFEALSQNVDFCARSKARAVTHYHESAFFSRIDLPFKRLGNLRQGRGPLEILIQFELDLILEQISVAGADGSFAGAA